jgi:hypothetical protein
MAVKEVSAKVNMTYSSAHHYYTRYLKDPGHAIPIQQLKQIYTQNQKNEFIDYIVNDKMSLKTASKKAKINHFKGYAYYHRYFKQENPDIPAPSHIITRKRCTQEQLNEAINEAMGYIISDKMSITAASRKANIGHSTTGIRYRHYLKDDNMKVPVKTEVNRYTKDQIDELAGYIVDDKMTVVAASRKANMSLSASYRHYRLYLMDRNIDGPIQKCITEKQKSELIRYIADDKMSIKAASKKANMCGETGRKYCRQHLNDQKSDGST